MSDALGAHSRGFFLAGSSFGSEAMFIPVLQGVLVLPSGSSVLETKSMEVCREILVREHVQLNRQAWDTAGICRSCQRPCVSQFA